MRRSAGAEKGKRNDPPCGRQNNPVNRGANGKVGEMTRYPFISKMWSCSGIIVTWVVNVMEETDVQQNAFHTLIMFVGRSLYEVLVSKDVLFAIQHIHLASLFSLLFMD